MSSFSFDGTDFKVESSATEIKTYQQLWSIIQGGAPAFDTGYMKSTSDGVNAHVIFSKIPSPALDLSAMTDFTISVSTTNADASWSLNIRIGSGASHYRKYTKALANDVTATYTLSDFALTTEGTPDMANVDYLQIRFTAIDTGMAGNVDCKVKDYKTTSPVKTSDMYDDTGMFVTDSENFEGDDELALDSYDSGISVVVTNASTVAIDDAQAPGGGSSSARLIRDGGADSCYFNRPIDMSADYIRFVIHERLAQTNLQHINLLRLAGAIKCYFLFDNASNMKIFYGDGVGGSNTVIAFNPYLIDTNYEIWCDIDFTNNTYRVWVDGVMYPGPNADAQGFDNMYNDGVAASVDNYISQISAGTGTIWIDDLKIYAGFEDFSALTAPHDIDDICEAVSPSGTDYGRGTWDGDWGISAGVVGVDNTDVVIGTNSLKATGLNNNDYIQYLLDSTIDITQMTHLRLYCKLDAASTGIRVQLFDTDNDKLQEDFTPTVDKWNYIDIELSGMAETGTFDESIFSYIRIRQFTAGAGLDLWIDGLHFYGDSAAGTEWQGNALDSNGSDVTIEHDMYNLLTVKDSNASEGTWTWDGAYTVEFPDVANAGILNDASRPDIVATGTDDDNHVVFTVVGDTAPVQRVNYRNNAGHTKTLLYVSFKYGHYVETRSGDTFEYVFSNCQNSGGFVFTSFPTIFKNCTHQPYAGSTYSIYIPGAASGIIESYTVDESVAAVTNDMQFAAAATVVLLNSTFDETTLSLHADAWFISKHHKKNKWDYILATGANGQAFSDLETAHPDHLPIPSDDFNLVLGQLTCGTDGQRNVVYHLISAAGTVILITCDSGFVVLDPDLSDVAGTLTETFPLQRGYKAPPRPIKLPLPRPIPVSET